MWENVRTCTKETNWGIYERRQKSVQMEQGHYKDGISGKTCNEQIENWNFTRKYKRLLSNLIEIQVDICPLSKNECLNVEGV